MWQGVAEGDGLVAVKLADSRADGDLGRAIGIEHTDARLCPTVGQLGGTGLATHHQLPQFRPRLAQCRQHRRHRTQHRDALGSQQFVKLFTHRLGRPLTGYQSGSGCPRRPNFLDRKIKAEAHTLIDAVVGPDVIDRQCGLEKRTNVPL